MDGCNRKLEGHMKIKISKAQWELIGNKAGWVKTAKEIYNPRLTTPDAKALWFNVNDYLTMADDPQYEHIRRIRSRIDRIKDSRDKSEMIKYFESEFGGSHTKATTAWEYYK